MFFVVVLFWSDFVYCMYFSTFPPHFFFFFFFKLRCFRFARDNAPQ